MSCKPFADFVRSTLLDRLTTGAISLNGKVGEVDPPHLVLPLTVEPTKPRLCHDVRFLNLCMRHIPFKLDTLLNLPRYVGRDTYQTILDDKSGYDHLLLTEGYSGVGGAGGTLVSTPSLLAGKYPVLYTTPLV